MSAFVTAAPLLTTRPTRLQSRCIGLVSPLQFQVSPSRGLCVRRVDVSRRCRGGRVRMADGAPPIDAPSGVLLLLSSVLAIASVGCVFELAGGNPQYGVTFTGGVLAVSLPGFLFLFYSAIRKGQQEAAEDS
eukprot:GFKZ01012879.1.p2 GENE.GFKZ01012879.1~~GFKZ01012879.1.p2  ORF type:complete len:132 (-),score=13.16 GFKZ01012879.1:47-442(-)